MHVYNLTSMALVDWSETATASSCGFNSNVYVQMLMCLWSGNVLQGLLFGSLALYEQTAPAAADAE
jgi:hypothetical protein